MIRPNAPGWLIVLEGIDGAGKSTVVRRLVEYCTQRGLESVTSFEPTRGTWGQKLRQSMVEGRLSLEEELGLFLKDRAEHVAALINPAIERGAVIILDRYYFSTAAYQGARGLDPRTIIEANEKFSPIPNLVLLLDLDPTVGATRITRRGDVLDDFEGLDYQREVRRIFLSLKRPFIRRIDASQNVEAVFQEARAITKQILNPN